MTNAEPDDERQDIDRGGTDEARDPAVPLPTATAGQPATASEQPVTAGGVGFAGVEQVDEDTQEDRSGTWQEKPDESDGAFPAEESDR